jgi:calcineurin-like phosphoesterase family protein
MSGCRSELTEPTLPTSAPLSDAAPAATPTDSVLLLVAGDMHADCGLRSVRDMSTAGIVKRYPQALVIPMGDNTMKGRVSEYACYDQSWGAFKSRTYAVVGNHEYDLDPRATAHYDYFNGLGVDSGRAGQRTRGYYTVNYGGWRILIANSSQNRVAQTTWMSRMLAASPARCTMAIWHRPLYTSSAEPDNVHHDVGVRPWWNVLYGARADLVLNGHAHNYERFAELRPDGGVDTTRGIREIVVGTGGSGLYGFDAVPQTGSIKRIKSWGVLKLTLWPTRYRWQFIDTMGVVQDQGADSCH